MAKAPTIEARAPGVPPLPATLDLNALLSRATATVELKSVVDKDKVALRRGTLTKVEIAEAAERQARWEAAHEWDISGLVLMVTRTTCTCSGVVNGPCQLMTKQTHRRVSNTTRLQRPAEGYVPPPELPRTILWNDSQTDICLMCAIDEGFTP